MMQGDGGSFTHSSFVPRDLSNRIRKGFPPVCNSVAWTLQPACQPFWGLRSLTTRSQCGYELLSAVAMATTANTSSNNVKHGNSRHKIRVFSNVSPLMIEIQRRGIPLPLFPFPYMFWSLTSFPHSAFGVSTSLIFTNLVFWKAFHLVLHQHHKFKQNILPTSSTRILLHMQVNTYDCYDLMGY